jgi:type III pantothenate kinase
MKMLAIDIGNSNIKCGVIENGVVLDSWGELTTNASSLAKELHERAGKLPFALSSVVPVAAQLVEESFRKADVRVSADSQKEIKGFYSGFGADRVADAVAAKTIYGQDKNVVVIGLGTGTVLTAVSAAGSFVGGLITLGLGSTAQTLNSRIPQLPAISFDSVSNMELGTDTISSMHNGTLLAHLGALQSWIDCAKGKLAGPTIVVATGGWSTLIAKQLAAFDHVDAFLTLKGTYLIGRSALLGQAVP